MNADMQIELLHAPECCGRYGLDFPIIYHAPTDWNVRKLPLISRETCRSLTQREKGSQQEEGNGPLNALVILNTSVCSVYVRVTLSLGLDRPHSSSLGDQASPMLSLLAQPIPASRSTCSPYRP